MSEVMASEVLLLLDTTSLVDAERGTAGLDQLIADDDVAIAAGGPASC
jgi:hypothetical protein